MLNDSQVDAYLARIGAGRPERADAAALAGLQVRHLAAVPFENLDIHLGVPIVLEVDQLFDKIVSRRRGGFCYELNGMFGALLRSLGFDVTLQACRVFARDGLGPPFDHLALRVELDEPWLADVGFGRHSRRPLRLDHRAPQHDPEGVFQLVDADLGDVDVVREGQPQYRMEPRPRDLGDFEATCWWQQTSPKSHFTEGPVCSMPTEGGRVTLSDDLLIETVGDERRETRLAGEEEILSAYRELFAVELDRRPAGIGGVRTRR